MGVQDFQHLILTLENSKLVAYCNTASYVLLLYDFFLTLGLEVELVWPTPWSVGKVLFVATRYPPLVDGALTTYFNLAPPDITPGHCAILFKTAGWLIVWGIFVAELILVFRTWAIWGRNSKLAIGLLVFLHLLAIPTALFAHYGFGSVRFGPSPSPQLKGCWSTQERGELLFIDYIMIVVFESVILGLTVWKGLQHLQYSHSRLMVTLFRDGVLYYVYLIGFSLLNIIILVLRLTPGPSLILMQRVLHSMFTARMLLNLREAAGRDREKHALTSQGADATVGEARPRTALSSVIIGVDTWFRDPGTSIESTTIELA